MALNSYFDFAENDFQLFNLTKILFRVIQEMVLRTQMIMEICIQNNVAEIT